MKKLINKAAQRVSLGFANLLSLRRQAPAKPEAAGGPKKPVAAVASPAGARAAPPAGHRAGRASQSPKPIPPPPSRAAGIDEDSEEELHGNGAAAAARRRERARCAAIIGAPAARRNPALAANAAFKTRMTRKEAIVMLESIQGTEVPDRNQARADRNPRVGVEGPSPQPSQRTAAAAGRMDEALAVALPKRRP